MKTYTQEPETIGARELQRNLKKIFDRAGKGESFIVQKNARPMFRILPMEVVKKKKYTKKDLEKIQFQSGERNLSGRIDEILYEI